MIKENEKAKTYFSKTVDMQSDEITAKSKTLPVYYIQYASVLSDLGYFPDAAKVISRGRDLWPENKELTYTELQIYMNNDKTAELADKLKTALDIDPNNLNLLATYAGTLDKISSSYSEKKDTINSKIYMEKAAQAYQDAIDKTIKYKSEIKYKIEGNSSTYDVTYMDEKGNKIKAPGVVAGWEYSFNATNSASVSIIASAKDKRTTTRVIVFLAGSLFKDAQNEPGKNFATLDATIKKEDLDKSSNLFALYYNLGVLYYNPGVEIYTKARDESDLTKIAYLEKQYLEFFNKALPYLEKAQTELPTDLQTLKVLQKIYLVKKDNEKAKAIKEEIDKQKKNQH